ncbi:hypothetical protein ACFFK0_21150 [Paenibacillus chartarius]|uniref:Uncharacterized protein n=1 Tax=Paenibacillus chartarius TaxID=747481 RepID=A0ABV6DQI8_9BACL
MGGSPEDGPGEHAFEQAAGGAMGAAAVRERRTSRVMGYEASADVFAAFGRAEDAGGFWSLVRASGEGSQGGTA